MPLGQPDLSDREADAEVIGIDPNDNVNHAHEVNAPSRHRKTRRLSLSICDVRMSIAGLDATLWLRLADLLRPFVAPVAERSAQVRLRVMPSPEVGGWVLTQDNQVVRYFSEPNGMLRYLEWLVVSQAIMATKRWVAFHGAALARDEAVVVVTGASGVGKTTLTLGLMQRGWEPFADDLVLVDPNTLNVQAFPRCFHLDAAMVALADASLLERAGALDGYARPTRWAEGFRRPTTIVVAERCATCPSWRAPMTQAMAAAVLASSTIENRLGMSERVAVAVRVAAAARTCVRLCNGHLDGALNLIEEAAGL